MLWLSLGLFVCCAQQPKLVLDLTQVPPGGSDTLGYPGRASGGAGGTIVGPTVYKLPVSITLVDAQRAAHDNKESILLELHVRNAGTSPLSVPISQEHLKVLRQGNRGRYSWVWWLEVPKVGGSAGARLAIGVADASVSVSTSSVRLAPNESMAVKLACDWQTLSEALRTSRDTDIRLQVGLTETRFEDSRYFISAESGEALSSNSVNIH